ncbi:MAG: TetR/AcrR family transcriptional regulator [Marinobacterium sp.]|nr:TetR/AcrR family transcriptional regulator [Marinobacterium sp.]
MTEKQTLTVRKKNAIVAAAVDEFLEKGFASASMDDLASRAGVSKRTVYNHFASKEQLFAAIVEQLTTRHLEMTCFEYLPEQPVEAQLRVFAHKQLALLMSDRFIELARLMMAECMRNPALAEEALARMNQQEDSLENWLARAMAEGRLQPAAPAFAAGQFVGLIKSAAFWPQLMLGQPLPDEQCCQQIVDDALCMFMARYGVVAG